jgi:hypothetical protein
MRSDSRILSQRGGMTYRCVMSKADDFRQYADEALRFATESKSESQKQALMDLARTWTQAALKAEAVANKQAAKIIQQPLVAHHPLRHQ